MINLDGTQSVSNVCHYFDILNTDCIVNVHLKHGITLTYSLDNARNCLIAYRMKISADSNALILDLYTY